MYNSKVHILLLGMALLVGCQTSCTQEPVAPPVMAVSRPNVDQIHALVDRLAARKPPPHATGYHGIDMSMGNTEADVAGALKELKQLGPRIFPMLVAYRGDNRYSYSGGYAAWHNHDVGFAVVQVLCGGEYMHSGYKWRDVPGSDRGVGYLSFEDYLDANGWKVWAEWASTKSRLEIQMDFIDWCLAEEAKRGYVDEAQEQSVLESYKRGRAYVKKKYSEQSHPPEPAVGPKTNGESSPPTR